jgi:hypothetical protein
MKTPNEVKLDKNKKENVDYWVKMIEESFDLTVKRINTYPFRFTFFATSDKYLDEIVLYTFLEKLKNNGWFYRLIKSKLSTHYLLISDKESDVVENTTEQSASQTSNSFLNRFMEYWVFWMLPLIMLAGWLITIIF